MGTSTRLDESKTFPSEDLTDVYHSLPFYIPAFHPLEQQIITHNLPFTRCYAMSFTQIIH